MFLCSQGYTWHHPGLYRADSPKVQAHRTRSFNCLPVYGRPSIVGFGSSTLYTAFNPGAVLEISLSIFQSACLWRTHTVGSSRRVFSDAATQIFAKISNFSSWRPKKGSSLHFLYFESKQRPLNTAIQLAVYASWNVVAEKGRTHRRGKILSCFWKPQKPL